MSRDRELEAAIAADPEDPAGYLVYADHLQAAGDPRGDLIAVQAARAADPESRELAAAETALFAAHRRMLFGPETAHAQVEWSHGFWRRLYLGGRPGATALDEHAAQLLACPSAKFLRALHCEGPFTPGVLAQAAPRAATLRELEVSLAPQAAFADEDLGALAPLTRLRGLVLGSCEPVTAGGTAVLGELRALERLDLRNCPLTDAIAATLATLPLGDVTFDAVSAAFSADGMRVLARAPLRRLHLGTERVDDAMVAPLAAHPTLANLELNGAVLTAAGVRALGSAVRLRRLRLASSTIDGRDLAMLAPLAGRLESLSLNHSDELSDPACEALSAFERLAFLDVAATAITGAGLRALGRIGSLAQLDLAFLPLDDADLAALASLPALRCLNLAYTQLTDRTLDTLARLPRLEKLDLAGTKITAAAIDGLAAMPALLELGLSDCDGDAIERAYDRPQWHVTTRELIDLDDGLSAAW
ncbi:MAG TPA: TIGR02996 domain-containing protein [Kofleriaceae bacterium]